MNTLPDQASTALRPRASRPGDGLHRLASLTLLSALGLFGPAAAQTVDLGTAGGFAVLGASAVTNTGPTIVNGDLGISPNNASSVTGFPPGIINGSTHFADALALSAQNDTTTAYNTLAGRACNATISADLGGSTLVPGVYCSASTMGLTGTLTLDAQNDPDAVFIFKIGSTLTTASASNVQVINGGQHCNVFWQVGSSATLGTGSSFIGNILALASITLTTGSSASGHLLARTGAVTLDDGLVSACTLVPGGANPPTISKSFSPAAINVDGQSTLTVTLSNANATAATLTADLVDHLPAGVFVAALPNAATSCDGVGTPIAAAGGSTLALPAGRIIPANTSCTVSVNVTSAVPGSHLNTIPTGALTTTAGNNPEPAEATLVVIAHAVTHPVPTLSGVGLALLALLSGLVAAAAMRAR
ncbi:MAG: DUF3494 domain-containing protein [Rhodanobacteraceae bacterium]|nr:DUF3494 domain-containing protein [Rhodanobacteraceae bacterium]MBL0042552.1 DUF3494 domain-containing protein [Xanthomonadales bacterium]MBP6077200.1 DUF3494 domain-containing protein [Xanthomonadales bacterium]MBP7622727.1 DUF3494 domain-containing protein [Xanthomonadales bacterium]